MTNATETTDRVSRAEAARQLGVNRSTVTRLIKANPALIDDAGLVSVRELRNLRENTIDPRLQTKPPAAEPVPAETRTPSKPTAPVQPSAPTTDLSAFQVSKERSAIAKAMTDELDLADRLDQTMARHDVVLAAQSAADVLKRAAQDVIRDEAEQLAAIDEPRQMEIALDDLFRAFLQKCAAELDRQVGDRASDAAA